jgi:hypothetical protein
VEDDELYDINPFLSQNDLAVTITTSNPSADDNLFLAVIAITARARVTTENCSDGIDNDGDDLVDSADPDCVQPLEICANGIDDDGDGLVDEGCPSQVTKGSMIGGGAILGKAGKITHGFVLWCNPEKIRLPSRMQANWGRIHSFHLTALERGICLDDPAISEGRPEARFDTYQGKGSGRYDGKPGATAEWTVTDAGKPRNDKFQIKITDRAGNVVLDAEGTLKVGDHQALPIP